MVAAIQWMRVQWQAVCLLLAYLIVFVWQLAGYVNYRSLDFQLGMLALWVVSASTHNNNRGGVRFALVALLMAAITILLPVKTMLYVTVLLSVFFVMESCFGRMPVLSLLVVLLVSPVCRYALNVFSFPIRLSLTKWVGGLLSLTGHEAGVEGNIILYKGNEFSVDPACMGMYMLITSLLCGVMIATLQQKKQGLKLTPLCIVVLLVFIVGCNLLCNLCRIFILVYYKILPEAVLHEVIGIACFVLYIITPVLWFSGWIIKKYGRAEHKARYAKDPLSLSKNKWLHLLVLLCTAMAAVVINNRRSVDTTTAVANTGLYKMSSLENNITKLENDFVLIYIKSIPGFYSSDHHPMICWAGSGYEFTKVHIVQMEGKEMYAGVLNKGSEKLYTAWWYDNGEHQTIEQWDWRWNMLKGSKSYNLINITAASTDELTKQVSAFNQSQQRTQNFNKF